MLGSIQLEEFKVLTKMPQKAATAWSAGFSGFVGADYEPLLFVGTQIVKGINYWFIAEQKTVTRNPERHIVKVAINEFKNVYEVVPQSIERIF